jgi:hypothetical protein
VLLLPASSRSRPLALCLGAAACCILRGVFPRACSVSPPCVPPSGLATGRGRVEARPTSTPYKVIRPGMPVTCRAGLLHKGVVRHSRVPSRRSRLLRPVSLASRISPKSGGRPGPWFEPHPSRKAAVDTWPACQARPPCFGSCDLVGGKGISAVCPDPEGWWAAGWPAEKSVLTGGTGEGLPSGRRSRLTV